MNLTRHGRPQPRLQFTLSTERWDRSKNLRNGIGLAFVLCSLGAAGNWYNWLHGIGSLPLPVGLTIGAVVALMLTPRKWELLLMSAGGILGLEVLAILLRKGPVGPMLGAIVVTAAVAAVCQYIRVKVDVSQGKNEVPRPNEKRD